MELENERDARIGAEDVVAELKEQLSAIREAENTARAESERSFVTLQAELQAVQVTKQFNTLKLCALVSFSPHMKRS